MKGGKSRYSILNVTPECLLIKGFLSEGNRVLVAGVDLQPLEVS